jgi:hypothetical protein
MNRLIDKAELQHIKEPAQKTSAPGAKAQKNQV